LIYRLDLLSVLLEACRKLPRVELSTNEKVVGCEHNAAGVTATTATGEAMAWLYDGIEV